jgi:hypothetical protein
MAVVVFEKIKIKELLRKREISIKNRRLLVSLLKILRLIHF